MAVVTFTPAQIRRGGEVITPWLTVYAPNVGGGSTQTLRWSDVDIADGATWGGQKDGRVLGWGGLRRRIDFLSGAVDQQVIGFEVSDIDRVVGTLLESTNNRFWLNSWEAKVEIIGDTGRAALDDALVLGRGLMRELRSGSDRQTWAMTFGDLLDLDLPIPKNVIAAAYFADCPADNLGLVEPIIYGLVSDVASTNKGAVPTIYVGTETISSVVWHRFLVARHACKNIDAIYSGGTVISAGQYGVDVLAPGYTGWPFGTVYRDLGTPTRRYTLIYARGPVGDNAADGTATLTCNVQGIEASADAITGTAAGAQTLITDVVLQFRHFLIQFVLTDWLSGSWNSNPVWSPAQPTLGKVDEASFAAVAAELVTRLAGGYVGAGVIGYGGVRPARDVIASWLQCCDAGMVVNGSGQIAIYTADAKASAATYTEDDDIIGGLVIEHDRTALYNVVPYSYAPAYTENQATVGGAMISTDSITAFKIRRAMPERAFEWIRDSGVASNNAAAVLARHRDPPRRVGFLVPVYGIHRNVADYVSITHRDGTGSAGWTARACQIEEIDYQAGDQLVRMTVFDRGYSSIGGSSFEAYTPGGGAIASGGTGSASAVSVAVLGGDKPMGGSLENGHRVNGLADVFSAIDVTIDWSISSGMTHVVTVWGFTRNAAATWRAEVWTVVGNASNTLVVQEAAARANTTREERTITIPASTGVVTYRLRVRGVSTAESIYLLGVWRVQP